MNKFYFVSGKTKIVLGAVLFLAIAFFIGFAGTCPIGDQGPFNPQGGSFAEGEGETPAGNCSQLWVRNLNVPLLKQNTDTSCGRFSALMVIKYYYREYFPGLNIDLELAEREIPE